MCLIVGVDGGGTKTRCAVSDGVTILGRGESKGCNIVRLGESAAREAIQTAIRDALLEAKLEPNEIQAACIGVAGSSVPRVRETVMSIAREVLACAVTVVGDQQIAFEAAFGDSPGILVIGGTGSIACGRNASGTIAHAGGHGFIISDEGSGQWIGRNAVSSCLRALDAGTRCELMPLLLEAFHVNSRGELIQAANSVPLPNFSELLPVVLEAARGNDAIAIEVLKKAGWELAALAKSVAEKLGMKHDEFHVAMAGGVFENSPLVRDEFERSMKSTHPQAKTIARVIVPLLGALTLARKQIPSTANRALVKSTS